MKYKQITLRAKWVGTDCIWQLVLGVNCLDVGFAEQEAVTYSTFLTIACKVQVLAEMAKSHS